ncbi:MAG: glycoside hydrolase family 28 protein [Pirellulales bacterium]
MRAKYARALAALATFAGLMLSAARLDAADATGWAALPEIEAAIKPPTFPNRDYSISSYGAKGDGQADCRPAIDQAIAACVKDGGGRVVVPSGDWLVKGPIHLKSGVNLHLAEGATVRFSTEPADYLPVVLARYEGNEVMNFSPFLYAIDCENIAITGSGTFDGQSGPKNWWRWKGSGNRDQESLRQMGEDKVPVADRQFGAGHELRPNFVQPQRCKNVLIEGVTFTNSPMWNVTPVLCENVTVRGITVDSHGPNNDGCDPESCRNVLIENCTFDTGDDCIAIKSGRNADGRRINVPSENIIIRACNMRDGHGGVVLGSEMSGGIRNVFVEDCEMDSPNLERAIRLKSNTKRGGYLENLYVRNVEVGQVADAVVRINLNYDRDRGEHPPTVRNIFIERVTSEKSKHPLYFAGLEDSKIENVVLENCTFKNAERPSVLEHVGTITLRNVRLLPKEGIDRN